MTSTPTSLPPALQAAVVQIAESMILTYLLDVALCGALTVQMFIYYQAFPTDRRICKTFAYATYVLQLTMTGFVICDAFSMYGSGFTDILGATRVRTSVYMVPILGGVVSFATQSLYAYRIYILSGSRLIPGLVVVISLASSVAALVVGAFASQASDMLSLYDFRDSVGGGVWFGASALSDILIAVCMIYYLKKSDTGFQTHAIISRLVRIIIETGSMTGPSSQQASTSLPHVYAAIVAVVALILFFALPDRVYYMVGVRVVPKLYSIAALMILNSRATISNGHGMPELSILSSVRFKSDSRTSESESRTSMIHQSSALGPGIKITSRPGDGSPESV
ncbi:hypothetical protein FB45DRAFT_1029290 [Roridomyces roridus]|uniref:DUF6534 domain-containing protein n=1 Tax=Roridomyces roridus TaxID=1738132 RepID=A0AAD7FIW8_9AGAR|nr:hypothetical protein FB45DRAFT_1029290 [Roridomyces roridus]